jgi:hypothetical protein
LHATTTPEDVEALGTCPNLEEIWMFLGDGGYSRIPSLRFLGNLKRLKRLTLLIGYVDDADLGPLFDLPVLESVSFTGRASPEGIRRLRDRGVEVDIDEGKPSLLEASRPEAIKNDDDGTWTVSGSFCGSLGFSNNYALERAVLKAIPEAVRRRLDPDSEAGLFSITANTREDVAAVEQALASLAKARSRPK